MRTSKNKKHWCMFKKTQHSVNTRNESFKGKLMLLTVQEFQKAKTSVKHLPKTSIVRSQRKVLEML